MYFWISKDSDKTAEVVYASKCSVKEKLGINVFMLVNVIKRVVTFLSLLFRSNFYKNVRVITS